MYRYKRYRHKEAGECVILETGIDGKTMGRTTEQTIEALVEKLMADCGLGAVLAPVESVSGGYLHRMYRVSAAGGSYAVKYLNPEIMARQGVFENYARAEEIERILEKEGIPIVPAITVHGKKMQNVEGHYFYIFGWQEGHITDWNNISTSQCHTVGNILGRIHGIRPENVPRQESEFSEIDWHAYILRAKQEGSGIASLLEDNKKILSYAVKELNRARASLPDILCLSDEDMDPKNVMWENGNPRIIDLECLDYGNPVSHALQLALQWAGIVTYNMYTENLTAFFDGYLEAYDNGFRAYGDIFGMAYSWVDWLEYNIRRALGECMDEKERAMGISETGNTIKRIRYIYNTEKDIKAALAACLRPGGVP